MYPDIWLLTPSGCPKYKITIRCSPSFYSILYHYLHVYAYIFLLGNAFSANMRACVYPTMTLVKH